jgi:hypothetical protein
MFEEGLRLGSTKQWRLEIRNVTWNIWNNEIEIQKHIYFETMGLKSKNFEKKMGTIKKLH